MKSKLNNLRLFPIVLILYLIVFYDLVTGIHGWELWVPIVLLLLERCLTQIVVQILAQIILTLTAADKQVKQMIQQLQGGSGGSGTP